VQLKPAIKQFLGGIPFTAELYWQLRQNGKPLSKSFSLRRTEKHLPEWLPAVQSARRQMPAGKRVMIFTTLRYWIEHATLMGLAMAGLGHEVTLAYLPYANWQKAFNLFDLRRQNAYAAGVLEQAAPYLKSVSFLDTRSERTVPHARPYGLPAALAREIEEISCRDVQYTLQIEEVDLQSPLYRLRLERNAAAARAALAWMQAKRPEVLVTPNGSILEMGAVYQVARHLNIPAVTYEFGEQRGRIWLAQNGEVMRQDTGIMWQALKDQPLSDEELRQVRELFASRQRADLWQNFSRRWQGVPGQGGEQARAALGLDDRPLVLLAANVIGDSLTLGRQVFSSSMTEWLQRTVQHFAGLPSMQLVVRIHPGERYTKGPSVADVVRQALPDLPENIRLVAAGDPVNTYDLVEIADLGLVYTTTVGMEMAMSGVPVIVAGQTHYRERGFTLDPDGWQAYFDLLERAASNPPYSALHSLRLSRQQVDQAWKYASRFFFNYPRPFPWHLLHFWNELEEWPMARLLSQEGLDAYGATFECLLGGSMQWQSDHTF
jgi:hypothetical protein